MSRKNKKYSGSRLREIALMASKGLPAELIAEIKGLPPKSVANICWIYKWSPEKLDEMTERAKLRGPKGDDARTCLRRYFVMHPEQRPAPHLNLFREGPKEAIEGGQLDRPEMRETVCQPVDAGKPQYLRSWPIDRRVARLEDLAACFRGDLHQLEIARDNHDERLSNNRRRIEAFQHFVDDLSHLPVDKIESTIGSLVADLAAKDNQIDNLKEELSAQRRTLGVLSARVEALENHRQDLSWRVAKQEQNQTALLYNDEANKISAEQFRTLSDNVAEMGERIEELDRSIGAIHSSHASRICNIEKILKQDVIDGNAHEQIEELKAQAAKLEERSHIMAKCSDDQVLELHKRFDEMTPKLEAVVTQVTHLAKKYDELSTEQIRPVIKVDHRLDAMTRQIERLEEIFSGIAEILPREFE